jgi:formylglycine-generating enzyme required for sulfatase activity
MDEEWVVSPLFRHHPVTGATWYGASSYCQWTGGRLCTEAEWVKGARGGCEILGPLCKLISPAFPWGNQAPDCDQANAGFCNSSTQPVAQYGAGISKYGMYDMLGNVWELVGDCWHGDFTDAPADGSAWVDDCLSESRVRVGGAFNVSADNVSVHIRAAATPEVGVPATGFRCCHD